MQADQCMWHFNLVCIVYDNFNIRKTVELNFDFPPLLLLLLAKLRFWVSLQDKGRSNNPFKKIHIEIMLPQDRNAIQ